jgi:hypothetical protein
MVWGAWPNADLPRRCAATPTSCTWRSACPTSRSHASWARAAPGCWPPSPLRRPRGRRRRGVSVGFEDASRADPGFLAQAAQRRRPRRRARALRRHAGPAGPVRHPRAHRRAAARDRHRHRDARPQRPGPGHRQHAGRAARRRHARQHHRQRPGRTCRQRGAGRGGDGRAPPAGRRLRRRHHALPAHLAAGRAGLGPAGGAGQEHRRRRGVHARVGHPRRRPAEGPRQLRGLPARGAGPQPPLVLGKHSRLARRARAPMPPGPGAGEPAGAARCWSASAPT